ncbi:unnamed protein product [Porites lobata]|uniref:Protein kinase domain-containing protein n=1 Tax=Porites lobata TaxID=104759 RepID=A0ABN8RWV0_9CNID|nr:unnamed protein product [Porites lobata]
MQQTMTVVPGAMIYSAPEVVTSNQTVKVDVYSFGVLLCEICVRELPDPRRREQQVLLMTNRSLRGLVRRCLQTDPGAKPTMQVIIDELSRAYCMKPEMMRQWPLLSSEIYPTDACVRKYNCGRIRQGCRMELLFKESMSQKRKLQFLQPRGSEAKRETLSRLRLLSHLRLACMKREMGPTAKATEIMEPAIQLICDREMTHFELQNSAKAASLAENLLLRNLKSKSHSADRKPEPLAHLYWDLLGFLLTNKETRRISPLRSIKATGRLIRSQSDYNTYSQASSSVDVYSFGVLLCEMCVRELPDPRRREQQVLLMTNHVLRGLVRRCLQTDPEARPTM